MKVKITSIFPPSESPRYMFGKTASNEYVVFSSMIAGADFPFELEDTIKFEKVLHGPAEALILEKNEIVRVYIHDFDIDKDVIRVRYDPQFE
jgi:hypothetical protein